MHLDDLHALLGSSPSSPRIAEFLTTLSSSPSSSSSTSTPPLLLEPEIKTFPGTVYHNYYDLGISLCYIPVKRTGKIDPKGNNNEEEGFKLDEIDIYNSNEDTSSASASGSIIPGARAGAGTGAGNTTGIRGKAARVPKTFKTFKRLPIEFPPSVVEKNNDATGSTSTGTKEHTSTSTSTLASSSASIPKPISSSSPSPSPSPPSTSSSHPFLSLNSRTTGRTLVQTLGESTKKGGGSGIGPFMQGVYLEWSSLGVQVDLEVGKDSNRSQEGGVWERAAGWGWVCLKVFEKGG